MKLSSGLGERRGKRLRGQADQGESIAVTMEVAVVTKTKSAGASEETCEGNDQSGV